MTNVNFTTPAFGARNKKDDKAIKIESSNAQNANSYMDLIRRVLQEGFFGNDRDDFEFQQTETPEKKKTETPEEKEEKALNAFCQDDYTSDEDNPVPKTPTEPQWNLIDKVKEFYDKGTPSEW